MSSKRSTGKNTNGPNQPPSCEVKYLVSDKPLYFPTFDFPEYILHIFLPNLPLIPHFLFHRHTRAYLQSIGQIPIIYQVPRSRASHRRTQPFSENKTLTSSIDDLIIDTISEIKQPIEAISHFETKEDPEFQNFLDFPEAQAGGFGPPGPPETNPPCTNPPSPRPNFNFLANMSANKPWLDVDAIAVPRAQHPLPKHPEKLLPKFDLGNDVTPEDHIKQFMFSLRLMDVQVYRLFPYTFIDKASTWFFSLITRSIASSQQFETAFLTQFGDDKTSEVLFLELSRTKFDKRDKVK